MGSHTGKIIGGVLGAMVAGPLGAGAGVFFGNMFDEEENKKNGLSECPEAIFLNFDKESLHVACASCMGDVMLNPPGFEWTCPHCNSVFSFNYSMEDDRNLKNKNEVVFNYNLWISSMFYILGRLAEVDGMICEKEHKNMEQIINELQLSGEYEKVAREYFISVSSSKNEDELKFYSTMFYQISIIDHSLILNFIIDLIKMANVDNEFHSNEEKMIKKIACEYFYMLPEKYDEFIRTIARGPTGVSEEINNSFLILECTVNDSFKIVKNKYHELVKKFHPDTIKHKDLPEEFEQFAHNKFVQIQSAYELLRGFFEEKKAA